ncbi:unnamed protein product [Chrysoparadoxa australica]
MKKQVRKKRVVAADDSGGSDDEPPPPVPKPQMKVKKRKKKSKQDAGAGLLSFGDEESGETFKISKKRARKGGSGVPLNKMVSDAAGARPSWQTSSSGMYSKEALAELKSQQPFQFTSSSAAAEVQDEDLMEEGRVYAGDEALLNHANEDEKEQAAEQANNKASDDFIPLDPKAPVPGAAGGQRGKETALSLEVAAQVAASDDTGDLEAWELELLGRGSTTAAAAPPAMRTVTIVDVAEMVRALNKAAAELRELNESDGRQLQRMENDLENVAAASEKLRDEAASAGRRFEFFQRTRDYLADVCGMLREKKDMISEVNKGLAIIREESYNTRRSARLEHVEALAEHLCRKFEDVLSSLGKYQPKRTAILKGGAGRAAERDEFGREVNTVDEVQEWQKQRRPQLRGVPTAGSLDALLSWVEDGALPVEEDLRRLIKEDILEDEVEGDEDKRRVKLLEAAEIILEDVDPEVRSLTEIKAVFEGWKKLFNDQYQQAFVSMSIPELVEPLVLLEMLRWEPIKGVEGDVLDSFDWYQCFFDFGEDAEPPEVENGLGVDGESGGPALDPDKNLVPALVERVALPLLAARLQSCYDPASTRQTEVLISAVTEMLVYEPSEKAVKTLVAAPLEQITQAVADVCVPMLNKTAPLPALLEGSAIVLRELILAAKLLGNLCAWSEVIAGAVMIPPALESLLCGKMVTAMRAMLRTEAAKGVSRVVMVTHLICVSELCLSVIPSLWLKEVATKETLSPFSKLLAELRAATVRNVGAGWPKGLSQRVEVMQGKLGQP